MNRVFEPNETFACVVSTNQSNRATDLLRPPFRV